jgi:hypothetical protein
MFLTWIVIGSLVLALVKHDADSANARGYAEAAVWKASEGETAVRKANAEGETSVRKITPESKANEEPALKKTMKKQKDQHILTLDTCFPAYYLTTMFLTWIVVGSLVLALVKQNVDLTNARTAVTKAKAEGEATLKKAIKELEEEHIRAAYKPMEAFLKLEIKSRRLEALVTKLSDNDTCHGTYKA